MLYYIILYIMIICWLIKNNNTCVKILSFTINFPYRQWLLWISSSLGFFDIEQVSRCFEILSTILITKYKIQIFSLNINNHINM